MLVKIISESKIEIAKKEYSESLAISFSGKIFRWEPKSFFIENIEQFLIEKPEIILVVKNKKIKGIEDSQKIILNNKKIILAEDGLIEMVNAFNFLFKNKQKAVLIFSI